MVLFASNVYAADTLVYDSGTDGSIQTAMNNLGISYDLRSASNPVTAADLASHDLLVVSWNWNGNMSGLSASVLESGITGKKLLTGHDADFHYGVEGIAAAGTFLSQAISWAQGSGGSTGLVALGDYSTAFSYLPSEWGISAIGGLANDVIDSFTTDGINSGVYNGLTPNSMSYWGNSYHASFTSWGAGFVPFELGAGYGGEDVVTIATPEPATMSLLGLGALSLLRRKKVA